MNYNALIFRSPLKLNWFSFKGLYIDIEVVSLILFTQNHLCFFRSLLSVSRSLEVVRHSLNIVNLSLRVVKDLLKVVRHSLNKVSDLLTIVSRSLPSGISTLYIVSVSLDEAGNALKEENGFLNVMDLRRRMFFRKKTNFNKLSFFAKKTSKYTDKYNIL